MRLPTEDAKREREIIIAEQNTNEGGTDQTEDLNPLNTVNVAMQTDLTAAEIDGLECDYQKKTEELAEINSTTQKGYPSEDDFKGNDKLLQFYTGLSSFTLLMALFRLMSVALPERGAAKLSKFEYFILTLMQLRLNATFRFGISESSVCRVFSKWIEAMDIRLSFSILWPDRKSIQKTMPFCLQRNYGLRVTSS